MFSLFHSILNLQVYKEQINCFLHMKAFGVFKRSPRIPLQYSLPWIQYHKSFEESSPFILQFPLQFSALNIFYFLSISLKVRCSKLNKMSQLKSNQVRRKQNHHFPHSIHWSIQPRSDELSMEVWTAMTPINDMIHYVHINYSSI